MPKKTKDEEVIKEINKKEKKATKKVGAEEKNTVIKKSSKTTSSKIEKKATANNAAAKKSTTKKASTKKATVKKVTSSNVKSPTNKTSTIQAVSKKNAVVKKDTSSKKQKATKKKSTTKNSTVKNKTTTKKSTTRKAATKKVKTISVAEYYDLPPTYNRTIVKILAQTPSSLFVYWEVSEDDKKNLQKQYGEDFFQNSKPYLIITNETMNYSFETEINDYANSWYIHINDSSCKYGVQLVRKTIQHDISTFHPVINIISSNEIATPNDHILFDKLGKTVFFKDVKRNHVIQRDISSLSFISNIGRVYNIYDLYKEIYRNELNGDELGIGLSSSGFSSTFH